MTAHKKSAKTSASKSKKASPPAAPMLVALYDTKTMKPDEIAEHLGKINK